MVLNFGTGDDKKKFLLVRILKSKPPLKFGFGLNGIGPILVPLIPFPTQNSLLVAPLTERDGASTSTGSVYTPAVNTPNFPGFRKPPGHKTLFAARKMLGNVRKICGVQGLKIGWEMGGGCGEPPSPVALLMITSGEQQIQTSK